MEYLKLQRKTIEHYGEREHNRMVFSEVILSYWIESLIADMFEEYRHSYLLQARIAMTKINNCLFGKQAKERVKDAYSLMAMNTDDKLSIFQGQLQAEYFRLTKDNRAAKVRCLYWWFTRIEEAINDNTAKMYKACGAAIDYTKSGDLKAASVFIVKLATEWKVPAAVETETLDRIEINFRKAIRNQEYVESIYKTDDWEN